MLHRGVIYTVVMWLLISVGPFWCVFGGDAAAHISGSFGVYMLRFSAVYFQQCNINTLKGPTNICSYITTELITHPCTIIGYFNKCNFSKHE